jgi:hypothetical protein
MEEKSTGFGLENGDYGLTDSSRWPRDTIYPQNLALASPTNDGRSVDIVRSRTQTTGFTLFLVSTYKYEI